MKRENFVGKTIGNWLILSVDRLKSDKKNKVYVVQCSCGSKCSKTMQAINMAKCCRNCRWKHRRVYLKCLACGNEYRQKASLEDVSRFCSKSCQHTHQADKLPATQFKWDIADEEEKRAKLLQNFYRNVVIRNGCWGYKVTKDKGYGRIEVARRKRKPLHVVSWEIHNGPIPKGMMVLHTCHVRECCRPSHLQLGTHELNMTQMVLSDRQAKGSTHGMSKLNEDKVLQIKKLLKSSISGSKIAKQFGITPAQVSNIKNGKHWRHVCIDKPICNAEVLQKIPKKTNYKKTPNRTPGPKLRHETLKRDNYSCRFCGANRNTNPDVQLHVDHIVPYSKGGKTIPENLQTLCSTCNLGKNMELP